jgi:hypothetical protein
MTKKSALEELAALLSEAQKGKKQDLPELNEVANDDYIQNLANRITPQRVQEQMKDPLAPLNQKFVTFKDMNDHYTLFINRIQQQLASIGGGGEVKFLRLDDVDASTVGPNKHLAYNPTTGKVFFEEIATSDLTDDGYTTEVSNGEISVINLPANTNIGPVEAFSFNTSHEDDHTEEGTLCWNAPDGTLNLHHAGGVTQQIGQETYAYVRNKTGVEIPNGTAVQFAGAEQNGTSRLLVAPMLADGTYPSLYVLGIATENIADGEDGRVTVWGKLRDIDTSDWEIGDLLYVSPETAGALTNVKPTAPNNCIPVAAVLRKDATEGEIFVRPTIEQQNRYGAFSDSTDQTLTSANQAKAVTLNTSEFRFGISIDEVDTSKVVFSESGLYPININIQILSTNSSAKSVWVWLRKNGVDVPYSSRVISIVGNNTYTVFQVTHNISMDADDYMQIMWAGSDTTISLKAVPATAFAPASPSVHLHIDQGAL